jgi:hypothetical protein
LCARPKNDVVHDVFCAGSHPAISGLLDLQAALHVNPGQPHVKNVVIDADYVVRYPVLLGHSTALSGHMVSPLNPRALLVGSAQS